jgi:hypothetical protein
MVVGFEFVNRICLELESDSSKRISVSDFVLLASYSVNAMKELDAMFEAFKASKPVEVDDNAYLSHDNPAYRSISEYSSHLNDLGYVMGFRSDVNQRIPETFESHSLLKASFRCGRNARLDMIGMAA